MPIRQPITRPHCWRWKRSRLVSAHSERTVAADDFFQDAFTTALEPGEIVLEIQAPVEEANEGYRYEKVAHPASGFAVVGVAVRIRKSGGRIAMARIGVTGMVPGLPGRFHGEAAGRRRQCPGCDSRDRRRA